MQSAAPLSPVYGMRLPPDGHAGIRSETPFLGRLQRAPAAVRSKSKFSAVDHEQSVLRAATIGYLSPYLGCYTCSAGFSCLSGGD